jgi:hypothetical protein
VGGEFVQGVWGVGAGVRVLLVDLVHRCLCGFDSVLALCTLVGFWDLLQSQRGTSVDRASMLLNSCA